MKAVSPGIFKAYDVRGTYPDQVDEDVAHRVGRGFARVLRDLRAAGDRTLQVAVGRDMRLHSPALADSFARGLTEENCDVLDIGQVGTEMVYYAVGSREMDGGVSVTASHNPKQWAGFKLVREGALPLSGDRGIPDVQRVVAEGDFPPPTATGTIARADLYEEFQRYALGFIDSEALRPAKVVLDGGNGMAGPMIGPLIDSFPVEGKRLYFEPNGEFPGHEPNPLLEENRKLIIDTVLENAAELGIAWDGDADRCFFIDDRGEFVPGDFLTALLAEAVLAKEPGATILYDVRASRAVPDTVERLGGRALVNRVGHAFFKARMREENAAFGGEVSGHYYFRDFWCADSGVIPALLVLELLSVRGKTMSELLTPFRDKYFISGEINSTVDDPEGRIKQIAERYSDGEITWLDGVSVDCGSWHFNVRPSNTEPLLRLNLEAFSQEEMEAHTEEVLALIRS
ncbi:MAG TPA: phosphomannomutase/phosphoglucomutase [Solirubrobacterales bacterium]|nr:phosphomannomutase/phosphoglucomutase [Solirubrobacterales bacterium]